MLFSLLLLLAAYIVFFHMTYFYIVSLIKKDSGIVDIGWGLGFVFIAITTLVMGKNLYLKQILITILILLWGMRLAVYIFFRNRGKAEDWRYKKWRDDWGKNFALRAYFQIFMLQGLFMFIISTPIILVNSSDIETLSLFDVLGTLIWTFGFIFETLGDLQLYQFKKDANNKGKIMKSGVWKYTRHPNYFGEVTMWWGIFLIALPLSNGIFTIISPILITFLLLKVSGIPLLEKKYKGNKEYEEYKKITSVFFPYFPKKSS